DDAARHQLAGARAAHRGAGVAIDVEPGTEAPRRGRMIEAAIGVHGPAPERLAVLDLLLPPAPRRRGKTGIVVKHAAEILGVVGAVLLDQARRLDDAQNLRIDPGGVETCPGDVIERPVTHTREPS